MTEAVIERLRAAGVDYGSAQFSVPFQVVTPGGANFAAEDAARFGDAPKVSCLMVTRGDLDLIGFSLRCYAAQTWANRELVVVAPPASMVGIEALATRLGAPAVKVYAAHEGMTLGELRNVSIAHASGDILLQWDDDDLHDPVRISLTASILMRSQAAAVFMDRWLFWWPARRVAAVSRRRACEGTMAVWRAHAPVYPALGRGEDLAVRDYLGATRKVACFDAPLQYVYAITGRNTWDSRHFEDQLAIAEALFEGDDYDALNALLATRMPTTDYAAYLLRRAAATVTP